MLQHTFLRKEHACVGVECLRAGDGQCCFLREKKKHASRDGMLGYNGEHN